MSDQNTTEPIAIDAETYAACQWFLESMPREWHREAGYRSGYHAGFIAGVEAAIATRPRNRVWEVCYRFWHETLRGWYRSDCAKITPPPTFQAPKRERGGAAKTKEPKA